MDPTQVVQEQSLIDKPEAMGSAEEGGVHLGCRRASGGKGRRPSRHEGAANEEVSLSAIKEEQARAHRRAERERALKREPVRPMQVLNEQRLSGKSQPMGKTEEGRADNYYPRINREKGGPKEEAVKMMMGAQEALMQKVVLVAERHKRAKVGGWPEDQLMLEGAEVARAGEARMDKAPVQAGVDKAPLEPPKVALKPTTTVKPTLKAAKTSSPMGLGRGGETPDKHNDNPDDNSLFHGFALLGCSPSPRPRQTKRANRLRRWPSEVAVSRIVPNRPAFRVTSKQTLRSSFHKSQAARLFCTGASRYGARAGIPEEQRVWQ